MNHEVLNQAEVDRRTADDAGRRLVEQLALALQASLLVRFSPAAVSDAFCVSRLGRGGGYAFGTLPPRADITAILAAEMTAV